MSRGFKRNVLPRCINVMKQIATLKIMWKQYIKFTKRGVRIDGEPHLTGVSGLHSPLQWRQNEHLGVWNHQWLDLLFKRLFRLTSMKISKPAFLTYCERKIPLIKASNAETASIWWHHHAWLRRSCIIQSHRLMHLTVISNTSWIFRYIGTDTEI